MSNQRPPEPVDLRGAGSIRLAGDRWKPDRPPRGAVLLLHGGGQSRGSWHRAAGDLCSHGWDVLAYDARGHGDSDWSGDGTYTMDDFADDLAAVVTDMSRPPVVVGASLGGRAALMVAGHRRVPLTGLALLDIAASVDPDGRRRVRKFLEGSPDGFARVEDAALAIQAYRGDLRAPSPDRVRRHLRERHDGRWRWHWDPRFAAFGASPDPAEPERLRRLAADVAVKTLVVRAERSDMVTPEAARELAQLTRGHLAEVQGGHMITAADNARFATHVHDYFS